MGLEALLPSVRCMLCGCGCILALDKGLSSCSIAIMSNQPTYQDLIQLLGEAEREQDDQRSTAEVLTARFRQLYPHIEICRPGRFLATVQQIDGPIRNNRLKGSSRKLYLKRIWTPRIRNTTAKQGTIIFLHAWKLTRNMYYSPLPLLCVCV